MTEATIRFLNTVNRAFYESVGESFSDTRQQPWSGWNEYLAHTELDFSAPLSVLDVGCGNGRFGQWLRDQGFNISYTGLDQSEVLLQEARHSLPQGKFQPMDIIETLLTQQEIHDEKVDLICVFGVLHHIPSEKLRGKFLQKLFTMLKPEGEIWVSIWLPNEEWRNKRQKNSDEVSARELEEGDVFLGWKETSAIRYVHWLELAEQRRLLDLCEMSSLQTWRGREKGDEANQYFLLKSG